jgi:isocitrate dehydrogenase
MFAATAPTPACPRGATRGSASQVPDRTPQQLRAAAYADAPQTRTTAPPLYVAAPAAKKAIVGVDVFVHAAGVTADFLAGRLATLAHQPRPAGFQLQMITNRGVNAGQQPRAVTNREIIDLLHNLESDGLDFIKTENPCTFDGEAGYALGQGQ